MEPFEGRGSMDEWLDQGGYLNHVLYRMCEEKPTHDDVVVVSGKIELIGRAYRVAPSRGAHPERFENKFYDRLAEFVVKSGKEIDKKIAAAREVGRISIDSLQTIVDAHGELDKIIIKFINEGSIKKPSRTAQHRVSFCSKYLHFHVPSAFPILDSRVREKLRKHRKEGRYKNAYGRRGGGGSYASFCRHLLSYANQVHDPELWTPRSIDGELYPYDVTDTLRP